MKPGLRLLLVLSASVLSTPGLAASAHDYVLEAEGLLAGTYDPAVNFQATLSGQSLGTYRDLSFRVEDFGLTAKVWIVTAYGLGGTGIDHVYNVASHQTPNVDMRLYKSGAEVCSAVRPQDNGFEIITFNSFGPTEGCEGLSGPTGSFLLRVYIVEAAAEYRTSLTVSYDCAGPPRPGPGC